MADVLTATWLAAREAALVDRSQLDLSGVGAASSGCAEAGAQRLAHERSEQAVLALARLRAGQAGVCMTCSGQIPRERLDAALTAVRCAGC